MSESQAKTFNEVQVDRVGMDTSSCDRYVSMALSHLFRKVTGEDQEFNSASTAKKHMVEIDGILVNKNRIVECLDYQ